MAEIEKYIDNSLAKDVYGGNLEGYLKKQYIFFNKLKLVIDTKSVITKWKIKDQKFPFIENK